MYSGFVTSKRVVKRLGIHQRFDMAAHRMVRPYLRVGSFPELKNVLEFEGFNGPDGLKVKSPGHHEPSHLYNPDDDSGEIPRYLQNHYDLLVEALRKQDMIRAAFEASWLAHVVTDGLTPAHHYPLEEKVAELIEHTKKKQTLRSKNLITGHGAVGNVKKNLELWGAKGHFSKHVGFEMGVMATLLLHPLRNQLDAAQLAEARSLGPVKFFKDRAAHIASFRLYDRYLEKGWSAELAALVRRHLAPATVQAIGVIWLLAYLEAGQLEAIQK